MFAAFADPALITPLNLLLGIPIKPSPPNLIASPEESVYNLSGVVCVFVLSSGSLIPNGVPSYILFPPSHSQCLGVCAAFMVPWSSIPQTNSN